MFLQFNCSCGKRLEVPSTLSGLRARCPACFAIVHVPLTTIPDGDVPLAQVVAPLPAPEVEAPPATPLSVAAHVLAVCGIAVFIAAAAFVAWHVPEAIFMILGFVGLAAVAVCLAGRPPVFPRRPPPAKA